LARGDASGGIQKDEISRKKDEKYRSTNAMRNSSSLIGTILGILWLPLLVGAIVVALAEALHLLLPWIYDHCLWIGDWIL
jgi:hypothetical protein